MYYCVGTWEVKTPFEGPHHTPPPPSTSPPAQLADEMPTQKIGFSPICKIIRDDLSDIIIFFIRTISPSHLNQKPLPKWQDDLTSEYKYILRQWNKLC